MLTHVIPPLLLPSPSSLSHQVLSDVTEHYTPLRTLTNGGKTNRSKRRRRRKKEPHTEESLSVDQFGCTGQQLTDRSVTGSHGQAGTEPAGTGDSGDGVECAGDIGGSVECARECSDGVMCAGRRWERRRHIKQLFIRGDNIVLIASLPIPPALPPLSPSLPQGTQDPHE